MYTYFKSKKLKGRLLGSFEALYTSMIGKLVHSNTNSTSYDVGVCVCVCACVRVRVCVCACVRVRVCVEKHYFEVLI